MKKTSKGKDAKWELGRGILHRLMSKTSIKVNHIGQIAFKPTRQKKVLIVTKKAFEKIPDAKVDKWTRVGLLDVNDFFSKEFYLMAKTACIFNDGRVMMGHYFDDMLKIAQADFPADNITAKSVWVIHRQGLNETTAYGISFRVHGIMLPKGYKIFLTE